MHSAVPPERRIRALEWGRGALTRLPNALDRVASPQPRCDLLFALHKTGIRLATRSLHRPTIELGILAHNRLSVLRTKSILESRAFFRRLHGDALRTAASHCKIFALAALVRERARHAGTSGERFAANRPQFQSISLRIIFLRPVPAIRGPLRSFTPSCSE